MYQRLKPDKIVRTAIAMRDRIAHRFPERGLSRIAAELVTACEEAVENSAWVSQPRTFLRTAVGLVVVVLLLALGLSALVIPARPGKPAAWEIVQGVQAAIQNLVFVGIAIVFLTGLERRWKRRRSLAALHALRSMAHIIDMHQLTKDPERLSDERSDPDLPQHRVMSSPDLLRYLHYCSDLLALISKAAALAVQDFDDPDTLAAVNEIENLTSGLSRKIWQKIMIFDRIASA